MRFVQVNACTYIDVLKITSASRRFCNQHGARVDQEPQAPTWCGCPVSTEKLAVPRVVNGKTCTTEFEVRQAQGTLDVWDAVVSVRMVDGAYWDARGKYAEHVWDTCRMYVDNKWRQHSNNTQ